MYQVWLLPRNRIIGVNKMVTRYRDERERMYMEAMKKARAMRAFNRRCHDCHVKPGQMHKEGCDSPKCTICGTQLLQCGHWKTGNSVHNGIENQELMIICESLGLFTKWVVDGFTEYEGTKLPQGHWEKVDRNDPKATYDLNKAVVIYHKSLRAVRERVRRNKD